MTTAETFTLPRPIKTHSGEITTLTLQEPTARAFVEYGEPFTLKTRLNVAGEPDGVTFVFDNNKALMRFLTRRSKPGGEVNEAGYRKLSDVKKLHTNVQQVTFIDEEPEDAPLIEHQPPDID